MQRQGIINDARPRSDDVEAIEGIIVAFADLVFQIVFDTFIDGKVKGDDGVAVLQRLELLGIIAGNVINAIVPGERLAGLCFPLPYLNFVDGQRQIYSTITIQGVLQEQGIINDARLWRDDGKAIKGIIVSFADLIFQIVFDTLIDNQMESHDTIAVVDGLELLDIVTSLSISTIVPGIEVASLS